jgi:putative MATE family efflux protein
MAFSIPLIVGNFFMSFSSILNLVWVGRLLGRKSVAAVSAGIPLLFLFPALLIGLTVATNILAAQARGRGDHALVKRVLTDSLSSLLLICLALSILGVALRHSLVAWVGAPLEIREDAALYLGIMLGGMALQFWFNWLAAALRALGDSRTIMVALIAMTVLNLVLVPLGILGAGPLPAMGLAGAAYGTLLASLLTGVVSYLVIARRTPDLDMRRWDFRPDFALIRRIFAIGVPASLQMIVVSVSGVLLLSFVNRFGTDATAAFGIAMQIDQLAFLPSMSIGIAATSMAGQNLGRGLLVRTERILNTSLLMAVGIAAVFTILTLFFSRPLGNLFLKPDQDTDVVLGMLASYYKWISWTYLAYAAMFTYQGIVRGAGVTMPLLLMTTLALLALRIPMAWWFSQHSSLGIDGIWMAMLVSMGLAVILSGLYYKFGKWREKKPLHAVAPVGAQE